MKSIRWAIATSILLLSVHMDAQDIAQIAKNHILRNLNSWELSSSDLNQVRIADMYTDEHNGLTHVYLLQQYNGIDVYNAQINVSVKADGSVLTAFSRFIPDLGHV